MYPIRTPIEGSDCFFPGPSGIRCPHVRELFTITDSTLLFDGSFYLEPEVFRPERPVKRILYFQGHKYLLSIHKKLVGKDTSVFWEETEETQGGICLFPTEITELHFTLLDVDPSPERLKDVYAEMKTAEPAIQEESMTIYHAKEEAKRTEFLKKADFRWLQTRSSPSPPELEKD